MIDPVEIAVGYAAEKAIEKTVGLVYKTSRRWLKTVIEINDSSSATYLEYMEQWKSYLLQKSGRNDIVTNAWAFSSREGFYEYERYIVKNMPTLYREVSRAELLIRQKLLQKIKQSGGIGGFVLYGYGNAYREANFIEKCITSDEPEVIMYDCSPVYHGLALSHFNPVRSVNSIGNITPYLVDIENRSEHAEFIVERRKAMDTKLPVLHLFFGNYACNLEEEEFRAILMRYTMPGDFIIFDHALYTNAFFEDSENDYTCMLAKYAIAEIFSQIPDSVVTNIIVETDGADSRKYVDINFKYDSINVNFRSMLRRNFKSEIIHKDSFDQIDHSDDTENHVRYILFKRT
jgi:hypothetical protein